jgi:hypothetical protein
MSERRERRFAMDLRSGRILDGTPEPAVEEIPEEEWPPIGEIEPITGAPPSTSRMPDAGVRCRVLAVVMTRPAR